MFAWKKRRVYLDYAGAMPERASSVRASEAAKSFVGNPGALHSEGVEAARSLTSSRLCLGGLLACKASEVIFTSGGTEGNNLAVLGWAANREAAGTLVGAHVIVASIEHPSVLETVLSLQEQGVTVSLATPEEDGRIKPETIAALLRKETGFVSVGWANGEIGTVQPLSSIARVIRAHEAVTRSRVVFHTDSGLAPLYLSPQVHTLGVDLATFDAGKLGGPRGVGILFVKMGTPLSPIFYGGSQEAGFRPGTGQVSLAAGFAAAFSEIASVRAKESIRLAQLRAHVIEHIEAEGVLVGVHINGTSKVQLPNLLNISIPYINNEYITLALDREGFAVATKSACREGEEESHVVAALEKEGSAWRARSALRISLGEETAEKDLHSFVEALCRVVSQFRGQKESL